MFNATILTPINDDSNNYVSNLNTIIDNEYKINLDTNACVPVFSNNKKNWENILPRQTALVNDLQQAFATSELLSDGENIFWSKLYQGKFLRNFTLKLTSATKAAVEKLLRILPRDLNSYTLTINASLSPSPDQGPAQLILDTFTLKNFKNGRIKIQSINTIKKLQLVDCSATIDFSFSKTSTIYIDKIVNCRLVKFSQAPSFIWVYEDEDGNRLETPEKRDVPIYTKLSMCTKNSYAIKNSKLIFKRCNLVHMKDKNEMLSAFASFISINPTNNLYEITTSNNTTYTHISKLNSDIFSFDECQATILPGNIKEGLEKTTTHKRFDANYLNNYKMYYINDLIQINNKFNLINHIHTGNTIQQTDLVPIGTRILFPQVIKTINGSDGVISQNEYKSAIPIPSGWALIQGDNTTVTGENIPPSAIFNNYVYMFPSAIPSVLEPSDRLVLKKRLYAKYSRSTVTHRQMQLEDLNVGMTDGITLMCFELSLTFSNVLASFEEDFHKLLNDISIPGMYDWFLWQDGGASAGRWRRFLL